jgi:hypothetical protein
MLDGYEIMIASLVAIFGLLIISRFFGNKAKKPTH